MLHPKMNPTRSKSGRTPRALLFFLLLSVFVISALPQEKPKDPSTPRISSAASEPAAKQRLTAKERNEVFEKVWREIHDHYYDASYNGVDWNEVHRRYAPLVAATKKDQEFYALMSQMTSELHDAHTRFNSPEQWKNFRRQQGVTVGFSVGEEAPAFFFRTRDPLVHLQPSIRRPHGHSREGRAAARRRVGVRGQRAKAGLLRGAGSNHARASVRQCLHSF